MAIRKNVVFLLILIFSSTAVSGNDKVTVYNAYISGDLLSWKAMIDRLQKQDKKSNEVLLTLVNYQYGYIGWCLGKKMVDEAETYILLARRNLAVLEECDFSMSMVYAYQSALLGYEIGINRLRAPFIGARCIKYAEQALKSDPANPFAYMQMGYVQYYMPSIFGGSVREAIGYFLKAKSGMEKNSDSLRYDWNYLHLLTLIAQAYADSGDPESAKSYYEMILRIEPRFIWIKNELYPQLLEQFEN